MNWTKVTVLTTSKGIEPVLGRLLNVGIDSTVVEDEDEFKSFLEENRSAWDYVDENLVKQMSDNTKVSFYIEEGNIDIVSSVKAEMSELKKQDKDSIFGKLNILFQDIEGEDWQNSWKKFFHTFEIGENLIIKPYWEDIDKTDKKVFEINPGLSFGTGTHHTTKMCLEDIITTVNKSDTVLDLGCGSGILSIVSMLFGAKKAVAVDIDENALKTVKENLERNNISQNDYSIYIGDFLTDKNLSDKILSDKYDVVLANIVADVIIKALPFIKKSLKPNGVLITSGIIDIRIDEVKDKLLSQGFNIISEKRSADWAEFKCKLA